MYYEKNGEYVGIDDKFIPEDEKYVDESLLGNNEETKKKLKSGAKIGAKVIGFGFGTYIIISLIGFIIFCVLFVSVARFIFNQAKNIEQEKHQSQIKMQQQQEEFDEMYKDTQQQIKQIQEKINGK